MKPISQTAVAFLSGMVMLVAGCSDKSTNELMDSARAYLAKNDSKAAIIELKNVLQKEPNSAEARYLLGKVMLDSGDSASAAVELRKALAANYPASKAVPLLAKSLLIERQHQRLVEQFDATELDEPAAAASLKTSLADAYLALVNPVKAQAAIRDALRLVPDYPATLLLQARLAGESRRFSEASTLIEKVIAATPNESQAWYYKAEYLYLGKRDIAGATEAYRKVLSIAPRHVAARSNLITVLLAQRDLPGAAQQIEELRKTIPNNPQTVFFDAQLAFLNRDYKKARDFIQQVLKTVPDNFIVLQLAGAIELSNGSLLEAERSLSKALALSPSLPVARRQLAQTLLRLGQPANALTVLQPLLHDTDVDAQTYSLAGEAYLITGEVGQAEATFAKAVSLDPKATKSRTALALTRMRSNGIDATTTELEDIAMSDKGTYADLALVSVYLKSKDFVRALKAVDILQAKQPDKPLAANLRGQVLLMHKDTVGARRSFESALAIDPTYVSAAASLAALDLADKKPDAARKRFESVLAANPRNLPSLLALAEMRANQGDSKDSVAGLLLDAIKRNPMERAPRLMLVSHYLGHKDIGLAVMAAQEAVAVLPDSTELLDALGRAQAAAGDTNQAITSFNKLVGLEPRSPQAHLRLAGIYLVAKNTTAAEQSLRRALAITPDLLSAQQALIETTLAQNRHEAAMLVARTMQSQRPNLIIGFMAEGAIEVSRQNFAGAAVVYRNVLKKFPSTDPATKLHSALMASRQQGEAEKLEASWITSHPKDAQFLLYMGEYAMSRRNFDVAEKYFRNVVEVRPDNIEALNNVAWIMAKMNKPGAAEYIEKADKLHPNSPVLMDTLATVLAANKQLDKAIEIQKKALALAPLSPVLQFNLAKLHIQAGNKLQARQELETLSKLGDKFAAHAEVDRLLKTL